MKEIWHVYPENDLRPHDTESGGNCWCRPVMDEESGVWVHNSMDGREKHEEGAKAH